MNITIEDSKVMTTEKIADAIKERNDYSACAFDETKGVFTAERDGQKYEIDLGGWIRKVDAEGKTAEHAEPDSANIEDQIGALMLIWAHDMDGKQIAVVNW